MIRGSKLVGFLAAALALGCGTTDGLEETASSSEALHVAQTPLAVTREYMALDDIAFPAGVAGGRDVVFVGSPFEARVVAYSRRQKEPIGELPAPPNGFLLPFIMKSTSDDRVAVLDAGGFPSPEPFIPANPIIYEYEYSSCGPSGFTAELVRTVPFSSAVIGFAEDAIQLDDGRYLVSDAILGSIWIAETDGTITPGLVPETFAPEDAIPELYFCDTMPLIEVGGLPFLFTASTIPGITAMAERNGTLYFASACAGALYSIPVASLSDDRQPWERAADIELVSSKPDGVLVEELLGLTFNPFAPHDPYLYVADALQLRVARINIHTGERQVVADDPRLLNFPSSLAFVPSGPRGMASLFAVSNQQHRTVILNDAITEDVLEPPFLLTEIRVRR